MSVSKYQMFVKTVECGSFSKGEGTGQEGTLALALGS